MSNHEDGQAVPEPQTADNQPQDEQDKLWMNALLKEPSASSGPILELNIKEYLSDFDEFDMTEEQKIELLQTLWNMMSQFVALGFEIEVPDNNCAQGKLDSSADSTTMVK